MAVVAKEVKLAASGREYAWNGNDEEIWHLVITGRGWGRDRDPEREREC